MTIHDPQLFVLTSEEGYFIVDLPGAVVIRARQGEEDLRQYEIDSAAVPDDLEQAELEVAVAFEEGESIVRLTGPNRLAITGVA